MQKSHVNKYLDNGNITAKYIIAHALWQRSRGRKPSVSTSCDPSPAMALARAVRTVLGNDHLRESPLHPMTVSRALEALVYSPPVGWCLLNDLIVRTIKIAQLTQRPCASLFHRVRFTAKPDSTYGEVALAWGQAYHHSFRDEPSPPPMDVSNHIAWRSLLEGRNGPAINFAYEWAGRMQVEIARGKCVADIAKEISYEVSHEADVFTFSHALQILIKCWRHGEELRRWHESS